MKPNLPRNLPVNRRDFIKRAVAGMTLPLILPHTVWGANSRINVAWIGAGGLGAVHLRHLPVDEVNVVAICDADSGRFSDDARERFPGVKFYQDFRVMFEEMGNDIDAVGIATPDHVHFPAAYMALARGKHVFVEKPMVHSVWEARTLKDLARRQKVKTQMGNQGHASEGIRLVKEWYEAGLIGDVREVIAWTNRPAEGVGFRAGSPASYPPAESVPSGLDWDQWLGPVKEPIDYNSDFHPLFWRGWWSFGCGGLGDIGCHTLDTPYWAMNLSSPTSIDVELPEKPNPIHTVDGAVVTYQFEVPGGKPPVKIKWYEGPALPKLPEGVGLPENPRDFHQEGGLVMIGDKGIIAHPNMRPDSPRLYPDSLWEEFRANPEMRPERTLPRIRGGIMHDFLRSIREGGTPTSSFDYAAPLTEMILLGTLAIRTGRSIDYDRDNMEILNNPEANDLLKVEARAGWDVSSLG